MILQKGKWKEILKASCRSHAQVTSTLAALLALTEKHPASLDLGFPPGNMRLFSDILHARLQSVPPAHRGILSVPHLSLLGQNHPALGARAPGASQLLSVTAHDPERGLRSASGAILRWV